MEKEEVLKKAKKKVQVGEMEKQKMNSGNWIALTVALVVAVAFIIAEGAMGHLAGYAIGAIIFAWAAAFYLVQYFKAKRPWQVLIGAVLDFLGFAAMLTIYILRNCGVF